MGGWTGTEVLASAADGAAEGFLLAMPLGGSGSATQDGRTARLRPGDFALLDGARPFELRFERPLARLVLTLPRGCLAPLLPSPASATAVRVRCDAGAGAVAAAAVQALARLDAGLDRATSRALADQVAGLVALAVGTAGAPRPERPATGRAQLLRAALDEVERSLDDPALRPPAVAARVGISTRYLHALFADHGPSFGRWVLIRRLERCRRDLADPAKRHWTIAAIGSQHGFRDASYLARAFRARYGAGPHAYRQGLAVPLRARAAATGS